MTPRGSFVCVIVGYIVGWWWRGRVTAWFTERDDRAHDALLDTARMFDDFARN